MAKITVILGGKTHYNEGGPYVVGGYMAEIDEDTTGLEKKESILDNENEYTVMHEYWLDGELVKRGGTVNLKKGLGAEGVQAYLG